MSNQVTGQLVKLNVKGPFAGKNDKPDFDVVDLTIKDEEGKETKVGLFTEVDASLDFAEGDTIHALFNSKTSGKFTNNTAVKVKKVTRTNTPKTQTTKKEAEQVLGEGIAFLKEDTTIVPKNTKVITVSKDTSMEVSGLLQALIHNEGLNAETPSKLRNALRLKREVAEELERKGTV